MGYLPKDLQTQVILKSPVNIAARVVDSAGFVVAKSQTFSKALALNFKAPPFAGNRLRAPGGSPRPRTRRRIAGLRPGGR